MLRPCRGEPLQTSDIHILKKHTINQLFLYFFLTMEVKDQKTLQI